MSTADAALRPGRLAIGSAFETADPELLTPEPSPEPWAQGASRPVYTQTGRQALALLAESLLPDRPRNLLVPAYLCDSMIQPFADRGWRLIPYRMTADLRVDHDDLRTNAAALSGNPFAVLIAEYFGRRPDAAYRSVIGDLRAAGGTVIDDETHRVLNADDAGADFAIASVRKVLPVASGGYVRSARHAPPRPALPDDGGDAALWLAMDEKRRNLSASADGVGERHRRLFALAGRRLERADTPRRLGERSRRTLSCLDYAELRERRRRNGRVLAEHVQHAGIEILNPPVDGLVPSHLVVRVARAAEVQRRMAAAGVFCPIHWPASALLAGSRAWPSTFLSLPVDHRYGPDDMRRAAHALREAAQ